MTDSALPEPLLTLAIPAEALLLEPASGSSRRELAVAALQQAMARRQLPLPLGPEQALHDPERLLILNRFAVQLLCAGLLSDELLLPRAALGDASMAPQLLLLALVDEEEGVVQFAGTLTATELQRSAQARADGLCVPVEAFRGGVDRLFTLVQLLEPAALPPLPSPSRAGVSIGGWLAGQLDAAWQLLGGVLLPPPPEQLAFRSASMGLTAGSDDLGEALAVLQLPLGLDASGHLCSGSAAETAIERFQLLLIPTARPLPAGRTGAPDGLLLRLEPSLQGDLLPDGLTLHVQQGAVQQSVAASGSTRLDLRLGSSAELISVQLHYPGSPVLALPPLQLPL